MAARDEAEHTYYTEINITALKVKTVVNITMSAIGHVHVGDSNEFWFWKNECIGEPVLTGDPLEVAPTWEVTGCICKVAFDGTAHTGTYESRLSSWKDAVTAVKPMLTSIYDEDCTDVDPKEIGKPFLEVDQTKKLMGIFFKLAYTREDVLTGSVPSALNENINVANISETFSGFQLKLRTNKNKAAKKLSKKHNATMAQKPSAGPSTSGSPKGAASPHGSGGPMCVAGESTRGSSLKRIASAFGSRKGYSELVDSPSHSEDLLHVATPSASRSPFKRMVGAFASRSPTERLGTPSATSSSVESETKEKEFVVYGLVNILQDKKNPIVLPLYSLDKDVVKFLFVRFGCGKIKKLQYVKKSKAKYYCKKHDIIDPFK